MRVVASGVVFCGCNSTKSSAGPAAPSNYEGQRIVPSKRHDDYENYPNKMASGEIARLQELVRSAKAPEHCADEREVTLVAFRIKVPGYGLMQTGRTLDDGRSLSVHAMEIPRGDSDRYLVYVGDATGYRLLDDVVLPRGPGVVTDVDFREGKVVYRSRDGQVTVERPMRTGP